MFQTDWFDGIGKVSEKDIINILPFDINRIEKVQFSFWAEHCLECAPPECYKSCEYYQKRIDGRCKRTEYGQMPVNIDGSVLGIGSIIKFRPWAKIETYIYNKYISIDEYQKENKKYQKQISWIRALKVINIKGIFNSISYYSKTRSKYRTHKIPEATSVFLFELFSLTEQPYKMIIEAADVDWKVIARTSVNINPGFNSNILDYKKIAPNKTNVVRFYPENSLEAEILIVNAEFVVLKQTIKKIPAKKVKCVVWDLDNTLWNGILSENDDSNKLELRDGVRELIFELDRRGVIQSIVSKNDYEPAWKKIKSLGLSEYFLYPAINWGQKSLNLISIAKELNINIDTFAVIDDSDFERREISFNLPQVRVYKEDVIKTLLSLPEFDLPVTEEAIHRRKMYQVEAERKHIQALYSGNYLEFIKSCKMFIEIGEIKTYTNNAIFDRCFELVSRTNQLNISGHRYSKEEFIQYLNEPNTKHIYIRCGDKFGEYGIVGYVSFEIKDHQIIIDELAISCRVAQKHVEYTIISWMARTYCQEGEILIKFIQTEKNMPMFNCLMEIGFEIKNNKMKILCNQIAEYDGIIEVRKFE